MVEELITETVAAVVRTNTKRGGEPLAPIQLEAVEHVARILIEGFHKKLVDAMDGR